MKYLHVKCQEALSKYIHKTVKRKCIKLQWSELDYRRPCTFGKEQKKEVRNK